MREYLFSVMGAAFVSSLILLILPDSAKGKKQVGTIISLAIICTVASPLSGLSFDGLGEIFSSVNDGAGATDAEDIYYGQLTELGCRELERLLGERISDAFSLSPGEFSVTVEAQEKEGQFVPTRVAVGLYGMAVFADPYAIEDFVSSLAGCDCDTYY